jgi:hypothetical protein
MKWTIIILWLEASSNYQAPRIGQPVGPQWFDTQGECEQHMMDRMTQGYILTKDLAGTLVKFPYVGGKGVYRCVPIYLPK